MLSKLELKDSLKKFLPFFLVLVAAALRVPALFRELNPYLFCDEAMFYGDAYSMYQSGVLINNEFRSGSLNSLPVTILAQILTPIFGTFSPEAFLLLGRGAMTLTLSALSVWLIYSAARKLGLSEFTANLAAMIYIASPFAMAMSRYWYPDHYVVFFSALFLWAVAGKNFQSITFRGVIQISTIAAIGLSVKLTFVAVLLGWAFFEAYHFFANEAKSKQVTLVYLKKMALVLVTTAAAFAILNYSIFVNFDQFQWAMQYNMGNYGGGDRNLSGLVFYLTILVLFASPLLTLLAIPGLLISRTRVLICLFAPIFIFLAIFGFQGMVVNRNPSVVLPHLLIASAAGLASAINALKDSKFQKIKFVYLSAVVLAFVANIYMVSAAWVSNLNQDSRILAIEAIHELDIGPSDTVGVNWSCSGQSPAVAAGIKPVEDSSMEKQLDYYIFDTAYWSSASVFKWGEQSAKYFWNQRYMHFYNLNDRSLLNELVNFPALVTNEKKPTIAGYEVVREVAGEGPSVLIIKKLSE